MMYFYSSLCKDITYSVFGKLLGKHVGYDDEDIVTITVISLEDHLC